MELLWKPKQSFLPVNTTISTSTNNSHVSELFLKLICQFWAGIVTEGEGVISKLTC
jgi:hypothetical protein